MDGRCALVTGGGRGIGAAIARALTVAGARVTVTGRTEATLAALVAAGGAADFLVADVTGPVAALPDVDILVNNAGAAESGPFAAQDRAVWDRALALNLTAVYAMTHAALPGMMRRGWGRVVNVASTAGVRGYPYVAAYVAAKHGVVGLTRALAIEMARTGVTVNAVCPGYTDTDMLDAAVSTVAARTGRSPDTLKRGFATPQGRLITPDEVAAAVVFLCGPGAASVTGQALVISGGEP